MAKILFALFTGIWFLSCMCSSRLPSHWIRFCSVHRDMGYLQYVLFNASLVELFSCVDPQMKRMLKSLPSCMPTCDKTSLTCFHFRIHKGEKPYMRGFNLSFLQVLAHWLKRWKAQWEKSRQKTQKSGASHFVVNGPCTFLFLLCIRLVYASSMILYWLWLLIYNQTWLHFISTSI